MPITVEWLIEGRILQYCFRDLVTVDEIKAAADQGVVLIEQSPAPKVHSVHDVALLSDMHPLIEVKSLSDAVASAYSHPRLGWMVAHNLQCPSLRLVANIVARLFQARYQIFETRFEALDFLTRVDETLPPLTEHLAQANKNTLKV